MSEKLRIVVADDEPDMLDYFRRILVDLGHQVVGTAENGVELVDQCRVQQPDLVITDIIMPEQDGIESIIEICRNTPLPIVLVTGHSAPEHLMDALSELVLAYLAKPFKRADLEKAIETAQHRFKEFQVLLEVSGDRRQAVEDRNILERAKGILTLRKSISDDNAFLLLQEMARDKNVSLVEVVQEMINQGSEYVPRRGRMST